MSVCVGSFEGGAACELLCVVLLPDAAQLSVSWIYHGMIECDAGSLFAHAGIFAGRHGLCDVCTLSSRARKVDSQLITRKSGKRKYKL